MLVVGFMPKQLDKCMRIAENEHRISQAQVRVPWLTFLLQLYLCCICVVAAIAFRFIPFLALFLSFGALSVIRNAGNDIQKPWIIWLCWSGKYSMREV